jgi:hypothetical protein
MKGSLNGFIGKRSHEKTEGFNEEENSRVHSRPRAGEIEPQSMLSDCNLTGLIFISKMNHKNRCFIPSTKNYFGGIQVKKVLCDTGCSTILLPLEEDQIFEIFHKFSKDAYSISTGESHNAGGRSSVLKIKFKGTPDFEVKLCQDLVGNRRSMSIERLRFALCSADVTRILNTPELLERLSLQGAANLRQDAVDNPNRHRRTHALLGMSVLKKVSSVRFSSIDFFVDPEKYIWADWHAISHDTEMLLEQIKLPECFDDWEDDDNLGCDDAEDFEYDEDE